MFVLSNFIMWCEIHLNHSFRCLFAFDDFSWWTLKHIYKYTQRREHSFNTLLNLIICETCSSSKPQKPLRIRDNNSNEQHVLSLNYKNKQNKIKKKCWYFEYKIYIAKKEIYLYLIKVVSLGPSTTATSWREKKTHCNWFKCVWIHFEFLHILP